MKFTKADLTQSGNLIKALRKGQFTLDGMEVLAFSDVMRWVSQLHKVIENQVIEDSKPPVVVSETKPPITDPVKKTRSKKE